MPLAQTQATPPTVQLALRLIDELAGVGVGNQGLTVNAHGVPRALFDATPGDTCEWFARTHYHDEMWLKTVRTPLGNELRLYTHQPRPDTSAA